MPERRSRRAALLDRDGTIVFDCEFTNDPADVRLLPGAARAIRALASAGYPAIVCTNQSGIVRGLISLEQYRTVRQRLDALLAAEGTVLLDTFTCPHHPDFSGPCDCRKPATGMYERAAAVHELDLSQCFFAGDKTRDINPALVYGARGALVRSPMTTPDDVAFAKASGIAVAGSLEESVAMFLSAPA